MRKSIVIAMLLLATLWQGLATARTIVGPQTSGALEHAVMHWLDQAHHHDDDGSFALDNSAESQSHLLADHTVAQLGLVTPPRATVAWVQQLSTIAWLMPPWPAPVLDGPLRPPRHAA